MRARLIPAGQLLRELEESGDVAAHGGWKRYAASGDLEKNTAIKGRSHTLVYSYLTVAHFGLEAFENALRRAAHENVEFASHSGLDWAVEVVRFGQGKKPKVLAAAAAAAKSETFSRVSGVPDPSKSKAITRIRQLRILSSGCSRSSARSSRPEYGRTDCCGKSKGKWARRRSRSLRPMNDHRNESSWSFTQSDIRTRDQRS